MVDVPPVMIDAAVPRVSGATGIWRFDEGAGSSILEKTEPPEGSGPMHLTVMTPSAVTWVLGGLRLDRRVTIATPVAPHVGQAIETSQQFTIEVWASTADVAQGLDGASDHATIVSASGTILTFNALIGQVGSSWIGRARYTNTPDGGPEIVTDAGKCDASKIQHLALVASASERTLYVDGEGFESTVNNMDMVVWETSYPIRIGDSSANEYDRSWLGTIYFLAIYDRALTPAQIAQNRAAGYNCVEC